MVTNDHAPLSPASGQPLQPFDIGRVVVWWCPVTSGVWVDNEAGRLLATTLLREDELAALRHLEAQAAGEASDEGYRQASAPAERLCPACGALLRQLRWKNDPGDVDEFSVLLDVCGAHGTWFDRGEIAQMMRLQRVRLQIRSEVNVGELAAFQRALRPVERGGSGPHGEAQGGTLWRVVMQWLYDLQY